MENYKAKPDMIAVVQKYLSGNATKEELKFLELYYGYFESEDDILNKLTDEERQQLQEAMESHLLRHIATAGKAAKPSKTPVIAIKTIRLGIAASLFITIGCGVWFYLARQGTTGNEVKQTLAYHQNNKPQQQAILTLANGKKINLDAAKNGRIAEEAGINIKKSADGTLVYTQSAKQLSANIPAYNTISTPNGRQYQLNLPDGTKVWLNAASALTYPVSFTGNLRNVELVGEAYFEVAKNANMPFVVAARGTKVEVLGTHFNVSAYTDDDLVKTALIEGSVRMSNKNDAVILKPGQQGAGTSESLDIGVKPVNVQQATAWKDGYFIFRNNTIREVMKQVARWYNVGVEYKISGDDKRFGGIYSRTNDLEELLKGLELTGLVKFKIITGSREGQAAGERSVMVMD
ncbi:DUF4974 domain-containing protein [Pedobacter sp. BS3]|uniref:FecR family protein n=1 Tax=Pedobacter sp. BS3 TaxID=2567937 RepID=UPI0011ED5C4D|nr:FecR family protein [Pedobacter sp. BS3]TZF81111.1 DUF4974 domain-containing protein [Pedobacter sp. BS3]